MDVLVLLIPGWLGLVLPTSLWVLFDAYSIGVRKGKITGFFDMGPISWFLCCLAVWIIAFPAYLAKRSQYKQGSQRNLPLDSITQLAALRDSGILTEAEFNEKKKRLLDQI